MECAGSPAAVRPPPRGFGDTPIAAECPFQRGVPPEPRIGWLASSPQRDEFPVTLSGRTGSEGWRDEPTDLIGNQGFRRVPLSVLPSLGSRAGFPGSEGHGEGPLGGGGSESAAGEPGGDDPGGQGDVRETRGDRTDEGREEGGGRGGPRGARPRGGGGVDEGRGGADRGGGGGGVGGAGGEPGGGGTGGGGG